MVDISLGEIELKCLLQFRRAVHFPGNSTEDAEIACSSCGQTVCSIGEFNDEVIAKARSVMHRSAPKGMKFR